MSTTKKRAKARWLAACAGACAWALLGCGGGKTGAAREQESEGNAAARRSVVLTVYADDFAQVAERRPYRLQSGANRLRVADVSKLLDSSSTLFKWSDPAVQVVSNTYDLGIDSKEQLIQRYLGRQVEMVWFADNGKPAQHERGTLEVAGNDAIVLRTEEGLLVNPTGMLVAPPRTDVVTIPQLTLGVESPASVGADLDLTYLTRGLSWSADYVATLDPEGDTMRLECWASVVNSTGIDYPDAKLTLVAGSPNRATRLRRQGYVWEASIPAAAAENAPKDSAGIVLNKAEAPVSLGELQAYPIKAAASIVQGQINRVRMLYGPKVAVKKDYSVEIGSPYDGYYETNASSPKRQSAQLAIAFTNEEASGLGIPLPGGGARFYEPDASGQSRYIGAATVSDTPLKGRIDLTISSVFDVYVQTTLVKSSRIDKRHTRQQAKVVLSNRKKQAVELRVVKRFGETWRIESESSKSGRVNAYTNQWKVLIPAGKDVELTYSVILGP